MRANACTMWSLENIIAQECGASACPIAHRTSTNIFLGGSMVVIQPTAPSLLTFAFMRVRPDASSFIGGSCISTISPTFTPFEAAPSSTCMVLVRVVSLITLKM